MFSLIYSSIFNQHLNKKEELNRSLKLILISLFIFIKSDWDDCTLNLKVHCADSTQVSCSYVYFFRFYISKYQVQILHPGTYAHCMNFEHMKIYQWHINWQD